MRKLLWLFFLPMMLLAVTIDGQIGEWDITQRLYTPEGVPPTLATDKAIYGRYEEGAFKLALVAPLSITNGTTIWIDADNNASTGYKLWGAIGGMEYFCNVLDGKVHLYKTDPFGSYVATLESALSADGRVLELSIPASSIHNAESPIALLADINDQIFYPNDYWSTKPFVLDTHRPSLTPAVPKHKIAIVFSKATLDNFFTPKSYSQLFMTMQYQAMQAGVPFDLLREEDLVDIEKIKGYDLLVFPYFANVPQRLFSKIYRTLFLAQYYYHIPFVTAGDFMTNYEDGRDVEGNSYRYFSQLFGLQRVMGSGPLENVDLLIAAPLHPALEEYEPGEKVMSFEHRFWYSVFGPVQYGGKSQEVRVAADQKIGDLSYPALFFSKTGAMNVHFATIEYLADTNLLYPIIDWLVYKESVSPRLRMTRQEGILASRNDMDQSQFIDEVKEVDGALLDIIRDWKERYNFVGSFYINIGNNPPEEWTDWDYSGALYRKYVALGNEIGTHSWTHPHDTNILSDAELEFEFKESMDEILRHIHPNWRDQIVRGAAIPGAPERLDVAQKVLRFMDYLSGGYSGIHAGYPNAFGYLTPDTQKVYISPNMSFDFTMIEFGVPVWDPTYQKYVPHKLTPKEAKAYWLKEMDGIARHANMPIFCWPWHDYGPTTSSTIDKLYSRDMFDAVVKSAFWRDSEFVTLADLSQRIEHFKNAKVTILSQSDDTIRVRVEGNGLGVFALDFGNRLIKGVDGWSAYDPFRLYLPEHGGTFTIHFGGKISKKSRILFLPMRMRLIKSQEKGDTLKFSVKGEGDIYLWTRKKAKKYRYKRADRVWELWHIAVIHLENYGLHKIVVTKK